MTTPEEARESAKNLDADFRCASIYWPNVTIASDRLRDMANQVEALQADAGRYRWLRAGNYPFKFANSVLNDTPFGIDEAIDAARSEK